MLPFMLIGSICERPLLSSTEHLRRTLGWDFGGDGVRTMMLVYSLPATQAIYQRFGGIGGSAYFVGGFGMTALTANDGNNNIVLVPIRSGVGLRLGANIAI
jgi:hypothetical protein